jgi:dTDP-4-dehydrorhamnose reductase
MPAAVVVLGGSGLVGSRLLELWRDRFELQAPTHAELDALDPTALAEYLRDVSPAAIVNLAAWADVDGAEAQRDDTHGLVYRLNAGLPGDLAALCEALQTYLLHVSTDYVFDGENDARPYREDDPTNPLCWYAATKVRGEELIRQTAAQACIARIDMPFRAGPHAKGDFARLCLDRLRRGESLAGVTDQRITPVFLDDAAMALARLVEQRVTGTVHVAPTAWTTPYEFARAIAGRLGLDADLVSATTFGEFASKRAAVRPRHSWLDTNKAQTILGPGVLRSVDEQLDGWAAQVQAVVKL